MSRLHHGKMAKNTNPPLFGIYRDLSLFLGDRLVGRLLTSSTFTADFLESFPLVFYWCSVNAVRRSNINRYNNTKPAYVIETVASWNLGASADLLSRGSDVKGELYFFQWSHRMFGAVSSSCDQLS
uniref:Uncharacterized protein n=1 Tax=Daphnia galeata TaxID=27404 RepID=A0A8J2S219_9CRUS|nr:unnamed protein product [Daphnia galeata]